MSTISQRAGHLATQVGALSPPYVAATVQQAVAAALTPGVVDGSSAAAGEIGEYIEATISFPSAFSTMVSANATTIMSVSLTAGDWDVSLQANAYLTAGTGTYWLCGISLTNNVRASSFNEAETGAINTAYAVTAVVPRVRISVTSTTTVYAVGYSVFTNPGTHRCFGKLSARRVR
jgi:hypothetical protein